ncbi:MAG: LamG-like jellyroll fold domain-containing protein [Planctomycetota bacterium]
MFRESGYTVCNFGVGRDYSPGTYWSGTLDDIRIYDVALSTEEIAALGKIGR